MLYFKTQEQTQVFSISRVYGSLHYIKIVQLTANHTKLVQIPDLFVWITNIFVYFCIRRKTLNQTKLLVFWFKKLILIFSEMFSWADNLRYLQFTRVLISLFSSNQTFPHCRSVALTAKSTSAFGKPYKQKSEAQRYFSAKNFFKRKQIKYFC